MFKKLFGFGKKKKEEIQEESVEELEELYLLQQKKTAYENK